MKSGEDRICQACPVQTRLHLGCDKEEYLREDMVADYRRRKSRMPEAIPLTCHRRLSELHPKFSRLLTDYGWLVRHNQLPRPGGYHDQPAQWVQQMTILSAILGSKKDE